MAVKRSKGLLVKAQPLRAAEEICRRMVDRVWIANGALEIVADPAWAEAINTVLVKKGVRVDELRRVEDAFSSGTQEISMLGSPPREDPYGGCTGLHHVP
jgi:hypothetical protein